jgi:hypothetical protein
MSALLLTTLYLVLLWITSSLFRGKGILIAALGVFVLLVALVSGPQVRRAALRQLVVLMSLCVAAILIFEGLLYLYPGMLKGQLANYVSHGYHGEPGGIYVRDPLLAHAMRPSFGRAMYWSGHTWTHATNADGYRGPRLEKADAVMLGGATVYGHGVEEDQTIPARFAAATGLATANLGQQGVCPVQELELLRRSGLRLRPRLIFLCAQPKDVTDALQWYAPEELERFLAEQGYRPLARPVYRSAPAASVFDLWYLRVAWPLRSARALHGLIALPHDRALETPVPESEGEGFVPTTETVGAAFDPEGPGATPEERLGWQANRRALAEIKREAQGIGARLIVFDLGYPTAFSTAIEGLAHSLDATYCDTGRRVLARARAGERMYLARDGNWSPAGCDALARDLAAAVQN